MGKSGGKEVVERHVPPSPALRGRKKVTQGHVPAARAAEAWREPAPGGEMWKRVPCRINLKRSQQTHINASYHSGQAPMEERFSFRGNFSCYSIYLYSMIQFNGEAVIAGYLRLSSMM